MQVYETTFIVNPQLEDSGINERVNEVADIIGNNGGKTLHTDHVGTRRLAYAINGLTQGYYGCFIYEAPEKTPQMLERHFRLNDAYIRYLTVRFEGNLEELLNRKESGDDDRQSDHSGPSGPPVGRRRPEAGQSGDAETSAKPEAKAESSDSDSGDGSEAKDDKKENNENDSDQS